MRECAPRPCHAVGRKVVLCRPMRKDIFFFFFFFIDWRRSDDDVVEEDGFFLGNLERKLGRNVLREDIFLGGRWRIGKWMNFNWIENLIVKWGKYIFLISDLMKGSSKRWILFFGSGEKYFSQFYHRIDGNSWKWIQKLKRWDFSWKFFSGERKTVLRGIYLFIQVNPIIWIDT